MVIISKAVAAASSAKRRELAKRAEMVNAEAARRRGMQEAKRHAAVARAQMNHTEAAAGRLRKMQWKIEAENNLERRKQNVRNMRAMGVIN